MKQLKLFVLLSFMMSTFPLFAQEDTEVVVVETTEVTPVKTERGYYGENQNYVKFTSSQKKFNDWSFALYGGIPMIQGADLNTKVRGMDMLWSYDVQGVLTKQINHTFGLALQANWGKTEQQSAAYRGYTKYWTALLLGDVNLSNMLRRVDNKSQFRWALHAYGGIGTLQYQAFLKEKNSNRDFIKTMEASGSSSMLIAGGGGLRYKFNRRLDGELKAMYYFTGDEEFDGSGSHGKIAEIEEGKDDGLFTFSLGLVYKIGKHQEHLAWHDPLADIYPGLTAEEVQNMLVVCVQGDNDDDGVCDDWDRELNTPAGARVDGAGRALDTDLDGLIDLYDECVTLPGPVENNGCPTEEDSEAALNLAIANLEFSLDSDVISPSYYPLLDKAAEYLKYYKNSTYDVVGHTDTRASKAYNMDLSRRRANAVKAYLVEKGGVPASQLNVVAMGEEDLRFPECEPATKCPEWKNHANRRVVFVKK